jgi:hypothetical protein
MSQALKQGLVRRFFVPCPSCEKWACVRHMVCHHCDHQLTSSDLDPYREAVK